MSDKQASVKSTDMPEDMQKETIELTQKAMESSNSDGEVAAKLKAAMDEKFGETWHCTVGSSYGR